MRRLTAILIMGLLPVLAAGQCTLQRAAQPVLPNIFSPEQEIILGEVMADMQRGQTLDSPDQRQHLTDVGERLLHAAGQPFQVQFFISEVPVANAWALPGRVYVTRKLIAFLRNEDELAAVLAHELGHLLSHQSAIQTTAQLKEVLSVDRVTARDDIANRIQQLIESWRKNRKAFQHALEEVKKPQILADQLGLEALVRAGYRPEAMNEMFDRLAGTSGNTGSWLSDAFGMTSPDQRRLREMIRDVRQLPKECVTTRATENAEAFSQWQSKVEQFRGSASVATLHGLLSQKLLAPTLRDDLFNVAFSADGHYILGQDSGNVYIMTREPFEAVLRIDAPAAFAAMFTPDSKGVVFRLPVNRVEHWAITTQARVSVHEMVVQKPCVRSVLSPDGLLLACIGIGNSLALLDVATNAVRYERGNWDNQHLPTAGVISIDDLLRAQQTLSINFGFSPDGHYFAAGDRDFDVVVDLRTMRPISVPGAIGAAVRQAFAFLSDGKIVATQLMDPRSVVLRFPGGEKLATIALRQQSIQGAAHGDYVLVRPLFGQPLLIFDIKQDKLILGSDSRVFDLYDETYVRQQPSGRIALYNLNMRAAIAALDLPAGRLGPVVAADLSDDDRLLAFSQQHRGAVFDVENGQRLAHIRGFSSVRLQAGNQILARFQGHEDVLPAVLRFPVLQPDREQVLFEEKNRGITSGVYGNYIVRRTVTAGKPPTPINEGKVEFEVVDACTGQSLWRHEYPQQGAPMPQIDSARSTLGLLWDSRHKPAREELNARPEIKASLGPVAQDDNNGFIELLDLATGAVRAALAIDTQKGAFRPVAWWIADKWILVQDSLGRTLVYSSTDKQDPLARIFGSLAAVGEVSHLAAVYDRQGNLEVYDLQTGNKIDEFVLPVGPALVRFSHDGKRMLVLARDHNLYVFDTAAFGQNSN